jgi:cholesterol transport system auxiliary component
MKANHRFPVALLCSLSLALPACALLGKNPPLTPRYFTPDVEAPPPAAVSPPISDRRLRLGRIQAGAHLRERMAYRTSEQELGYYNERRWTERPESYLRRALSRSLFEVRGVSRAVSGAAPTLDAELIAFEELKGETHRVRVQIVMTLDDATLGSIERTITVERKIEGSDEEDPTPVVQALAQALSAAVEQICDQVVERLLQLPPLAPAPTPPPGTSSTTITSTTAPAPAPGKE